MPIIYIAGPLLNGHTLSFEEALENWKKAIDVGEKLMQKGWTVHIPHHSLFMWNHIKETQSRDIPWKEWMIQDSGMIKVSQALFFIGHSKGADRELRFALDNDKKVYLKVDDVPNVEPETCLIDTEVSKGPYEIPKTEGNFSNVAD